MATVKAMSRPVRFIEASSTIRMGAFRALALRPFPLSKYHSDVCPSEPARIRERNCRRISNRFGHDRNRFETRIEFRYVRRNWSEAFLQSKTTKRGLHRAGERESVTGDRLGAPDERNFAAIEHALDRLDLSHIPDLRGSAMSIDVIDFIRRNGCFLNGRFHRASETVAFRFR